MSYTVLLITLMKFEAKGCDVNLGVVGHFYFCNTVSVIYRHAIGKNLLYNFF